MTKAEYRRQYYIRNREAEIASAQRWHKTNRKRWMATRKAHRKKLRDAVLQKYGNKCVVCGYIGPALQIDHVFGDGQVDNKKYSNRATTAFLRAVLNDTEGRYQLLCANHNLEKYFNDEK